MSWNATVDRLRGQAQQYGLASDYVTAKVLYEAVDEIERFARRVPNPNDVLLVTNYVFGGSDDTDEGWQSVREAARRLLAYATADRATMEEA